MASSSNRTSLADIGDGAGAKVAAIADLVAVRIHIPSLATITTMKFPCNSLVYDVVLRIKAEVKELSEIEESKHFQLFIPHDEFQCCKWLNLKRSLKELRLSTGVLLEFKSAVRDQKVKLMDGRVNVFPIDDSFHVTELIKSFCKNIGIKNASDYAFCIDIEDDKIDSLDSKFDTFWLNDCQTLREQNIDTDKVIAFRRRFYNDNRNFSKDDRRAINKVFGEISEAIITDRLPVVQVEATTCGAVIAQITLGDKGQNSKIDFKQFLPKEFQKSQSEKEVSERYKRLQGLDDKMAKYRFLVEAKGLRHYGYKFFKVVEKGDGGLRSKDKLAYLGINPDVVVRVNYHTKEVISRWPLSKVVRFAASAADFSLDFGTWAHKMYNCYTAEADTIAGVVNTYYKSIQKCRYAFEELKNVDELFTTPWHVEKLETEVCHTPKGPFGIDAKVVEQPVADPKKKPGYDEFAEVYRNAVNDMRDAESLARHSSEMVQNQDDLEAVKESALSISEVVALTVAKICQLMSAEELTTRTLTVLKQLGVAISIQVPDLVLQLRILAKNEQIYSRSPTKYIKPAIGVASSAIPFMSSILPDSKSTFMKQMQLGKALIEACIFCQQELRTVNSAAVSYKLVLVQAAREVSAKILEMLKDVRKLCHQCPSSVQQNELNSRVTFVVDLVAQHFILTQALASFEGADIKIFLGTLEPNITKAIESVEASCAEFSDESALEGLVAAKQEVTKQLESFSNTLEGGADNLPEVDAIAECIKYVVTKCEAVLASSSAVITESQSLVDGIMSLTDILNEEDDDDEPKFASIVESLEDAAPEIGEVSRECACNLDDDALQGEFKALVNKVLEKMRLLQVMHA